MRISELAAVTGVSERSLRHYEHKGLLSSRRLENGYRDFDPSQIDRVKAVQFYLDLGLNTDLIAKVFKCQRGEKLPREHDICEGLLAVYERKLEEVNGQIESLSELKSRLEQRISLFKSTKTKTPSRDFS